MRHKLLARLAEVGGPSKVASTLMSQTMLLCSGVVGTTAVGACGGTGGGGGGGGGTVAATEMAAAATAGVRIVMLATDLQIVSVMFQDKTLLKPCLSVTQSKHEQERPGTNPAGTNGLSGAVTRQLLATCCRRCHAVDAAKHPPAGGCAV